MLLLLLLLLMFLERYDARVPAYASDIPIAVCLNPKSKRRESERERERDVERAAERQRNDNCVRLDCFYSRWL